MEIMLVKVILVLVGCGNRLKELGGGWTADLANIRASACDYSVLVKSNHDGGLFNKKKIGIWNRINAEHSNTRLRSLCSSWFRVESMRYMIGGYRK